jgi:hypothetical protein
MKLWLRIPALLAVSVIVATLAPPPASSTSMLPQNEVVGLNDGIDGQNLPYTEVTVRVSDSILGDTGSTLTFRQFGLLEPREMPNGITNLQVSPAGWPRFQQGEQVMLFLYKEAELTGLQTTVGLFQGKFTIADGQIVNEIRNMNLFHDVQFDTASLTGRERRLVSQRSGALPAGEFIELVRKAVSEHWVEQGRMIHAH